MTTVLAENAGFMDFANHLHAHPDVLSEVQVAAEAGGADAVARIAEREGFSLSVEALGRLAEAEDGQLDDLQLEAVAGGSILSTLQSILKFITPPADAK